MTIVHIDQVKVEVLPPDLDKDGKVGGVEQVSWNNDTGIQDINQTTELGDAIKEVNKDNIEPNTRMSGIDLRSRLHHLEVSSILALDALVSLGILPTKCLSFTRQKKRLAVSLDGKGRDDIVNIVSGKRELEAKTGFAGGMDRVKNMFGGGKKDES